MGSQSSGSPPTQVPPWQTSTCVQGFRSSQAAPSFAGRKMHWPVMGSMPFKLWQGSGGEHGPGRRMQPGTAGFEQAPVFGSQAPAKWHASSGVQVIGLPPTQVPRWQVSVCVQGLPSLQAVPSGATGFEQRPVAGLRVPATWQASVGGQGRFVHEPLSGLEHTPVVGLQVPASWQESIGEHVTVLRPAQLPPWHASLSVHASPSSQAVPSVTATSLRRPSGAPAATSCKVMSSMRNTWPAAAVDT